jgi:hypothetical protein
MNRDRQTWHSHKCTHTHIYIYAMYVCFGVFGKSLESPQFQLLVSKNNWYIGVVLYSHDSAYSMTCPWVFLSSDIMNILCYIFLWLVTFHTLRIHLVILGSKYQWHSLCFKMRKMPSCISLRAFLMDQKHFIGIFIFLI